jgi:serine/threonine protein phosphatase 1
MELIKKINFTEDDMLYVLGDIIDRGKSSLDCVDFVRSRSNIVCLTGNHELMKRNYFENITEVKHDKVKYYMWMKYSGAMRYNNYNKHCQAGGR